MKTFNSSPRDELTEPLRSILEDIASEPVPADLMERAKPLSAPKSKSVTRRSAPAIMISALALGLCIAVFLAPEKSPEQVMIPVVQEERLPPRRTEEIPPATLWAYREAHSADALDELLDQHADMLLPAGDAEDLRPFQLFPGKEDL